MLAKKEDGDKVLLKMRFLVPKTLRMKILELRLFKKLESEKLFLKKDLESYFQNQKGEIGGGMWPKGGHAEVAMQKHFLLGQGRDCAIGINGIVGLVITLTRIGSQPHIAVTRLLH